MASEDLAGQLPNPYVRQNSSNAVSLEFDPDVNYQFVEILDERYKCTRCHLVLHNPHQTGCGHRFCQNCIVSLRYEWLLFLTIFMQIHAVTVSFITIIQFVNL